ncbi:MAG: hypothetical protein JWR16_2571 [Nevskia sp.]|nr:hypothetical protein [Nevskia sp.]
MRLRLLSLCLPLLGCSASVWAAGGRPMTTDDATLTNARSCQIESYFQHTTRDAQWWVLPACNPTGNFEFSAGAALDQAADAANAMQYTLQGKWVWPHAPGALTDFATAGIAFGAFYLDETHHGNEAWSSLFAYVPLTLRWTDSLQTHFNLGWNRDVIGHHDDLTYAAALSHDLGHDYSAFVELFGVGRAPPSAQTGGAFIFLNGTMQLDATYGRPLNGSWRDSIFSIGLEWYPLALW